MKKLMLVLVMMVASTGLLHAKEYKIDENKRLEIAISASEQNRIKIVGDRIAEVVGMNGEYLLESEERQGQIFIKAQTGAQDLSFTIISEGGLNQDIKVKPKEGLPGQIIILKGEEKNEKLIGTKHARHEDIAIILKEMSQRNIDRKSQWQDRGDLKVRKVLTKRTGIYEVEIWELHNSSFKKSIKLSEKQFNTEGNIAAIMLEDLAIDPKDITKLYKVKYHG